MRSDPDRFASDNLPPPDEWPDLLLDSPAHRYPEHLNCVAELLDRWVEAGEGARPCLRTAAEAWTYADLQDRVDRIAHVLLSHGLRPGGRVLLRAPNTPMMVAAYLAVIKAGGIAVATMPLLRGREIEFKVTPKVRQEGNFLRLVWPQLAVVALTTSSLALAFACWALGLRDYKLGALLANLVAGPIAARLRAAALTEAFERARLQAPLAALAASPPQTAAAAANDTARARWLTRSSLGERQLDHRASTVAVTAGGEPAPVLGGELGYQAQAVATAWVTAPATRRAGQPPLPDPRWRRRRSRARSVDDEDPQARSTDGALDREVTTPTGCAVRTRPRVPCRHPASTP